MLIALLNIALNPFSLLFFILFGTHNSHEHRYFVSTGTNVSRLLLGPYLLFLLFYIGMVLLPFYGYYLIFQDSSADFWATFQPKYYWLSIIGWLASGLTISTYLKGMEGNIMGFIYFPLLLLPAGALCFVNISDWASSVWTLDAPPLELNLWIRFALHSFSPLYVVLFFMKNQDDENGKKEPMIVMLLSIVIIQLVLFGLHWLVFYLPGADITFSSYFGEGQSVLYYLPMATGFIFLCFKTVVTTYPKVGEKIGTWPYNILILLMIIMVFWQIINYGKFVYKAFL